MLRDAWGVLQDAWGVFLDAGLCSEKMGCVLGC